MYRVGPIAPVESGGVAVDPSSEADNPSRFRPLKSAAAEGEAEKLGMPTPEGARCRASVAVRLAARRASGFMPRKGSDFTDAVGDGCGPGNGRAVACTRPAGGITGCWPEALGTPRVAAPAVTGASSITVPAPESARTRAMDLRRGRPSLLPLNISSTLPTPKIPQKSRRLPFLFARSANRNCTHDRLRWLFNS